MRQEDSSCDVLIGMVFKPFTLQTSSFPLHLSQIIQLSAPCLNRAFVSRLPRCPDHSADWRISQLSDENKCFLQADLPDLYQSLKLAIDQLVVVGD